MDFDGNVMPSYYAGYVDVWLVEPYYFFQTGTVVVTKDEDNKLSFEINAVNSCGIPVHIVYGNATSSVEDVNLHYDSTTKQIINGHLYITREGKVYNVLGVNL
jgi:predicted heme/steroid binding protein